MIYMIKCLFGVKQQSFLPFSTDLTLGWNIWMGSFFKIQWSYCGVHAGGIYEWGHLSKFSGATVVFMLVEYMNGVICQNSVELLWFSCWWNIWMGSFVKIQWSYCGFHAGGIYEWGHFSKFSGATVWFSCWWNIWMGSFFKIQWSYCGFHAGGIYEWGHLSKFSGATVVFMLVEYMNGVICQNSVELLWFSCWWNIWMGTFFKIQWSYCGFHAGGIYEWGHFSKFSGATVVFMLVEYMNGDIFQTSVELLWFSCWWNIWMGTFFKLQWSYCGFHAGGIYEWGHFFNFSGATVVFMLVECMNGDIFQNSVELLWFSCWWNIWMGTFFKLQWSYCGFHAGGIYEWGHFSNFSGATVVFMLVEYMNGDIFQNSVGLLWFSCWWNIWMGTFFKLQWSYCGFHAGGIYEWGHFSNFSGATVVFMLVEYMNGGIFPTSVELLWFSCWWNIWMGTFFKIQWSYCGFHAGGIYEWGHFSNFSGATVVFMLVEYMNGVIFQTSVELLWFSCWWNIWMGSFFKLQCSYCGFHAGGIYEWGHFSNFSGTTIPSFIYIFILIKPYIHLHRYRKDIHIHIISYNFSPDHIHICWLV